MAVKVGDAVPDVKLKTTTAEGIQDTTLAERSKGKKIVLFAVPGAFTPLCSAQHLPGFIDKAADFRAKGVDEIVCLSVNDPFVMDAWSQDRVAGDKVTLVADGVADFTKAMGLEMDASGAGLGIRSQRYAAVIEDGVITKLAVEEPMKFEVSSAEAVLADL